MTYLTVNQTLLLSSNLESFWNMYNNIEHYKPTTPVDNTSTQTSWLVTAVCFSLKKTDVASFLHVCCL